MASRILDMGDILTLIEQAQKQFDEEEARKAAIKISDGSFVWMISSISCSRCASLVR
jgi:signal recognition particle GTPase